MARTATDQLAVWLDDPAFGPLQRIGTLSLGERGSIRFGYDTAWLDHTHAFPLDPLLDLTPGTFFPQHSNFGVFMDSCPDRWGQTLMKRREAIAARDEGRTPRNLGPWDFLLGVQDCTRIGALRFTRSDQTTFLADEALSAPPVARIAELQVIALEVSKKRQDDSSQLREWLKVLVAPGSSLGGARPKANLVEDDGQLWIAKFPAADDDYDLGLWENLLHDLARQAGVDVPPARCLAVGQGYHTFLVQRFDRIGNQRRFFASAMTMLGRNDTEEASYLELAEFVATFGEPDHIADDLEQLFRRVLFNVATANRDDHLRNHGFIRKPAGWRLAPAFDMNPSFKKNEHTLAFDLYSREPNIALVLETAGYYRLSAAQAKAMCDHVLSIVATWSVQAKRLGISSAECGEAEHLFVSRQ